MANDAAAVWVLIVDDHEMVRGLCEEVILTLGHRALMADSAIRALEIIEQQQVDIVIADIKMSGMSGIELL
ncbi:MAG: response regulator, partial [Acidobacteria bacterium]|nr:response regulator [Acidobacteriota bacterium]